MAKMTLKPYYLSTPKETRKEIDRIMKHLQRHGFATTKIRGCFSLMSRKLSPVRNDKIYFTRNKEIGIVALNPQFSLKINKNKTISFIQRK